MAIRAGWEEQQAANPKMFDGPIYLARTCAINDATLTAALFRTDFKTFLFWRSHPELAADDVVEVFGGSLIFSAEGHLLLGQQAAGNLNSGRVYPPCGLIDDSDVHDGRVDIDASIARELREETGLTPDRLLRGEGYVLACVGRQIAVSIEWRSPLPGHRLRDAIIADLNAQVQPELEDIVIVRSQAEIEAARTPEHALALLHSLLPA